MAAINHCRDFGMQITLLILKLFYNLRRNVTPTWRTEIYDYKAGANALYIGTPGVNVLQ